MNYLAKCSRPENLNHAFIFVAFNVINTVKMNLILSEIMQQ
jgi:hypothetical protein